MPNKLPQLADQSCAMSVDTRFLAALALLSCGSGRIGQIARAQPFAPASVQMGYSLALQSASSPDAINKAACKSSGN